MGPIYFQIQYGDVHSDGCFPACEDYREFMHALVDEYIDMYINGQCTRDGDLLEGSHLVFGVCTEHSHDDPNPQEDPQEEQA